MTSREAWLKFVEPMALDLTMDKDAWARFKYKHSHVQALYEGFMAGRAALIAEIKAGGVVYRPFDPEKYYRLPEGEV